MSVIGVDEARLRKVASIRHRAFQSIDIDMVLTDEEFNRLSCCGKCSVRWGKFRKSVWNKETREFCGKTKEDWGKTFVAFVLFYGVFGAFYACCFAILSRTLGNEAPLLIDKMSPIKSNPALNFEPRIIRGTTIIKATNTSIDENIERMETLYSAYRNISGGSRKCSVDDPVRRGAELPCEFDVSSLGSACSFSSGFGYRDFKPCVMLRINKVFGWNPAVSELAKVTCTLKDAPNASCLNKAYFDEIQSHLKTKLKPGYIPISCEGQNEGDQDNILEVNFHPEHGIPSFHFPFFNQANFQSPAVMVQFKLKPGVAVMVWCRLWTGSIKHDMTDQQGGVRFELMVDEP